MRRIQKGGDFVVGGRIKTGFKMRYIMEEISEVIKCIRTKSK
jgi:hypothetical protein